MVQAQDNDDVVFRVLRGVERERIERFGRSITTTELCLCWAEKNSAFIECLVHAFHVRRPLMTSLPKPAWSIAR